MEGRNFPSSRRRRSVTACSCRWSSLDTLLGKNCSKNRSLVTKTGLILIKYEGALAAVCLVVSVARLQCEEEKAAVVLSSPWREREIGRKAEAAASGGKDLEMVSHELAVAVKMRGLVGGGRRLGFDQRQRAARRRRICRELNR